MRTDPRIEQCGFTQSPLGQAASEVDRLRQENDELRSKLWNWTEARYTFTEQEESFSMWQRLDAVYEDLVKERDLNAAKAKHEHEWAEDLAKQCCEMEDALGFKQDQHGPSGEFIPTIGPWKERVRDLISKEGELEDMRRERDEARAACAAWKRFAYSVADNGPNGGEYLTPRDLQLAYEALEASTDCGRALESGIGIKPAVLRSGYGSRGSLWAVGGVSLFQPPRSVFLCSSRGSRYCREDGGLTGPAGLG